MNRNFCVKNAKRHYQSSPKMGSIRLSFSGDLERAMLTLSNDERASGFSETTARQSGGTTAASSACGHFSRTTSLPPAQSSFAEFAADH